MVISIHAPREGSDPRHSVIAISSLDFYPRSPRGERQSWPRFNGYLKPFLSTLPARGATYYRRLEWMHVLISIHAPREGSDALALGFTSRQALLFLSTLPARGATEAVFIRALDEIFLSTLPARGATQTVTIFLLTGIISIHAPREGSDRFQTRAHTRQSSISIHAPREGSD